jgi:hypothetical protein
MVTASSSSELNSSEVKFYSETGLKMTVGLVGWDGVTHISVGAVNGSIEKKTDIQATVCTSWTIFHAINE